KAATGGEYKMVTYDGGNPAVQAAVAHETEISTKLIAEQSEMVRAKKLRPLAACTTEDVDVPGIGMIPSLKKQLPNVQVGPVHFGLFIPKGVPDEVIATVERVWDETIPNSERLKEYAESK